MNLVSSRTSHSVLLSCGDDDDRAKSMGGPGPGGSKCVSAFYPQGFTPLDGKTWATKMSSLTNFLQLDLLPSLNILNHSHKFALVATGLNVFQPRPGNLFLLWVFHVWPYFLAKTLSASTTTRPALKGFQMIPNGGCPLYSMSYFSQHSVWKVLF